MKDDDVPPPPSARPGAPKEATRRMPPRRVAASELLAGAHELVIVHDGRDYRLRVTQNNKLILTA